MRFGDSHLRVSQVLRKNVHKLTSVPFLGISIQVIDTAVEQ